MVGGVRHQMFYDLDVNVEKRYKIFKAYNKKFRKGLNDLFFREFDSMVYDLGLKEVLK